MAKMLFTGSISNSFGRYRHVRESSSTHPRCTKSKHKVGSFYFFTFFYDQWTDDKIPNNLLADN